MLERDAAGWERTKRFARRVMTCLMNDRFSHLQKSNATERKWAKRFASMDEIFLKDILEFWPCIAVVMRDDAREEDITANLYDYLCKAHSARRHFAFRYCHEFTSLGQASDGTKRVKGRIDLAVVHDRDRERYLACECKRLNVVNAKRKGRASRADKYVEEGVMRYVSEKYSKNLPIAYMLGYVMDGDNEFAMARIKKEIRSEEDPNTALVKGPIDFEPVGFISRFTTFHDRQGGTPIEIKHALLPFRNIPDRSDGRVQGSL